MNTVNLEALWVSANFIALHVYLQNFLYFTEAGEVFLNASDKLEFKIFFRALK